MSNTVNTKRGRPALLDNKRAVADLLINGNPNDLSHFLKHKLADAGFLTFVPVKTGERGRPVLNVELTGRAKGFVALARNWNAKGVQPFQTVQA